MRLSPTRMFVAEAGCLWPFRPEVRPPSEPENDAMRRGKAVHLAIENAIKNGEAPAGDDEIARLARAAFSWQRDEFGDAERFTERVIGINIVNGDAKADYATKDDVPANHMPIVVDLCVIGTDYGAQVWDWKTGNPNSRFDYSPQAFANGLAVALATGADIVRTGLAYVSETGVVPKSWTLFPSDIEARRDQLIEWSIDIPTADPTPCSACRYCPARTICPAVAGAQKLTQIKPKPKAEETPMATQNRMALSNVVKGKIEKAPRVLLYGVEKIGKSTFAAAAPSPVFICSEDGTAELDVARFPEPKSWGDVFLAIDALATSDHAYKTVVIDTVDWLEPLCWQHVCKAAGKNSIEDFGYGRGYVAALDEWRKLLAALDNLRDKKGLGVILLAHSSVKPFKNPEGEDFDRYEMKVHTKAGGVIKEWCDAILFATYETFTSGKNDKSGAKAKGIATGARIVHTQRRAAWDAGNRYDLPETIPLDWQSFAEAVANRRPEDPAKLKAQIGEMLERVTDQKLHAAVTAAVSRAADNAADLARVANKLSGIVKGVAA